MELFFDICFCLSKGGCIEWGGWISWGYFVGEVVLMKCDDCNWCLVFLVCLRI